MIHLAAGPPQRFDKDEIWPFMPAFRDGLLRFLWREKVCYDLVHGHFWMSGWVATEIQRLCHIPCVQHFHATGKTKHHYQQDADHSPRERIAVELAIVKAANRLIAQCPQERHEFLYDYDARPERIALIPGAVNLHAFYPVEQAVAREKIGLAPNGRVIVYVGRLLPRKDIRNIVRALERLIKQNLLPEAEQPPTLLIVGGETEDADPRDTPEIGEVQHLAQELGIAQFVRCVGKRQPEVLRYYYSAGDVMVTTPWYEPFGLTPLEAMACGRPVIGSAVGGIPFTVVEGQTGLLVPPRDPDALATRLADLLADHERRARMGEAARKRVEQKFTWSLTAQRTASLYEALIAEQHRQNASLRRSQYTRSASIESESANASNW